MKNKSLKYLQKRTTTLVRYGHYSGYGAPTNTVGTDPTNTGFTVVLTSGKIFRDQEG